jgi:hypothetical protein
VTSKGEAVMTQACPKVREQGRHWVDRRAKNWKRAEKQMHRPSQDRRRRPPDSQRSHCQAKRFDDVPQQMERLGRWEQTLRETSKQASSGAGARRRERQMKKRRKKKSEGQTKNKRKKKSEPQRRKGRERWLRVASTKRPRPRSEKKLPRGEQGQGR